jgi:dihydroflavonol-4-reductase
MTKRQTMTDKPTLVTGASGHVGNNLVRHLLELGRTVRVFVRHQNPESLRGLNVETYVGDVLQPASLQAAMSGVSSVFHLAGSISIDGRNHAHMRQVNVEGTANVVDACLQTGVERLVHFSSVHALSYLPKDQPIDERRPLALDPNKHLPYDQSKAAGELAVQAGIEQGLNVVVLNPVGIFGPHDFDPSPGGEFLKQLAHRQLPGLVKAGYYWVDVRDVAHAAVAVEASGRCGEKYILKGEYATFKSIADWVQDACGARPPLLNLPLWVARIAAPLVVWNSRRLGTRPLVTPEAIQIVDCHQNIATDKAAIELGFQPRPLQETVTDTVGWLLDHEAVKCASPQQQPLK